MKRLIKFVCIIAGVILGFVLSKYFQVPKLSLATQIDGVAVTSLIISILIAALFYLYLDKEKEADTREKNLLLDQVKDLLDYFGSQNINFQYSDVELSNITSGIKKSFTKIKYLKELIEFSGINFDHKLLEILKRDVKDLKDLQTNSPRNYSNTPTANSPITIRNSRVTYNSARKIEIEAQYSKIYQETLKFLFYLNKK